MFNKNYLKKLIKKNHLNILFYNCDNYDYITNFFKININIKDRKIEQDNIEYLQNSNCYIFDVLNIKYMDYPSQTEDGFSLGGVDYESEDAALDALRSKPQSQLSEEEYDFLYSYKPQARSGANGMRLNKYSGGGKITLKNKRK